MLKQAVDSPPSLEALAPASVKERIASIDILRGIALLGILISNIDIFSGPETFYELPQWLPDTTFVNPHLHLNLALLVFKWIAAEGKGRFLLSALFGAGLCLLTERAERTGRTAELPDIYLRRNLWLCVLGLLHGTLLWAGDILLSYGLAGLLILFPCRKLKARTLLIAGVLLTCASSPLLPHFLGTVGDLELNRQEQCVAAVRQAGVTLTPSQQRTDRAWNAFQEAHSVVLPARDGGPTPHSRYLSTVAAQFQSYFSESLIARAVIVLEVAGSMLFGMGLYKTGFFTAELPWSTYIGTALLGLLVSAPFYVLGLWKVYQSHFDIITAEICLYLPYEFLKLFSGIGMIALLMLFIKSPWLRSLKAAFAAVGTLALTNYLLTSLICQWIFLWSPWPLYGRLTYLQHQGVMLGIWAFNLAWSLLWLRFFKFGPVEWLWRSLTYWKLQPMRLQPTSMPATLLQAQPRMR